MSTHTDQQSGETLTKYVFQSIMASYWRSYYYWYLSMDTAIHIVCCGTDNIHENTHENNVNPILYRISVLHNTTLLQNGINI
jgi:fermentation-respiration switch protein FrsA (DUF1100 family)